MKWIYQFGVTDFQEMSNLAGKLRDKLTQDCPVHVPEVVHKQFSNDGTRKWVFRVGEGAGSLVETVLIPADDKTGSAKRYVFPVKWVVRWTVAFVVPVSRDFNVT